MRREPFQVQGSILVATLVTILLIAAPALAQGSSGSPPADTVPTWVFELVSAIASTVILALVAAVIALWVKATKTSGLSAEQHGWLSDLHDGHSPRDSDQNPLWNLARACAATMQQVVTEQQSSSLLIQRLVEQNDGTTADLRQQLKDGMALHQRQQVKMLKLAVRVQRAVEALAGLETPEIESDLDDTTGD